MIRKKNKLIITFSTILIISIFTIGSIRASDAEITCDSGGCSGISGSIFNETNLTPGTSVSKEIIANNNYPEERNFMLEVADFSDSTPSLGDKLILSVIVLNSSSKVYGDKTLTEFSNDGEIILSSIPSGDKRNYMLEVSLDDVGNDYQEKTLSFDLRLGFEELSSNSVAGTTDSSDDGSSGGEVLGAATGNAIGNVLGLSATEGNTILYILIGSFLIILGLFFALIGVRKKQGFKIRRIYY